MMYDIKTLTEKHRACLDDMAQYFKIFFLQMDYAERLPRQVRIHVIRKTDDLLSVLRGPGFYCIATTVPTPANKCTLKLGPQQAPVVYRGHSHNVRERIESHLFYDSYIQKDSGRRFTVCLKLDGRNINVDHGAASRHEWLVATHSMPNSKVLVREAAEIGFDQAFQKPVGSER